MFKSMHTKLAGAAALAIGLLLSPVCAAQPVSPAMDHDLMEVTVPGLQRLYAARKYTVTQVTQWYLDRIARYDGIYRAVETVMRKEAVEAAAREDAETGAHGPLWGIPIVVKANTSIQGQVTTDGWSGFTLSGKELIAPRDAQVVAKLRAAGAIIIGHTNMPDFANSDGSRSSSFGRTGNAYDVRFSPGGSSSGTVTAVTANMAMLGTGTDTANSIRMPAATSAVVGVFPTRGLVSIAGIAPLDWMLDNTGPIARTVTDAAITLSVMQGPDPLDPVTATAPADAQRGSYTSFLKPGSLKGKRFGVPAFLLNGTSTPFHGTPANVPEWAARKRIADRFLPLEEPTRIAFLKNLDELRAAGATIVMDDTVLPDAFVALTSRIGTYPYVRDGMQRFLKDFGPAQYHSIEEYMKVVGQPIGANVIGEGIGSSHMGGVTLYQRDLDSDPQAEANVYAPRRKAMAMYLETMDRLKLDAYVYPPIQMPPPDETLPQNGEVSDGPHSDTGWVNMLGVPAVVVSGGFYPGGLPVGLEFSGRPWRDGDLLGIAYGFEQATHHRHPPVLVEQGLLPKAP
ncbi:MAG TPA: amidase [Rhizomicrobium sp.]|jgi:Asp-tRNA(Asn)/Glu-tRNA(Gln) amidotransferase A subunit family amidase